jgi:hypothetical protein
MICPDYACQPDIAMRRIGGVLQLSAWEPVTNRTIITYRTIIGCDLMSSAYKAYWDDEMHIAEEDRAKIFEAFQHAENTLIDDIKPSRKSKRWGRRIGFRPIERIDLCY